MGQAISTAQVSRLVIPQPMTRELNNLVSTYQNRMTKDFLGRFSISKALAPTDDDRKLLASRVQELNTLMTPAKHSDVELCVIALFAGYPSSRQDGAAAEMTVKVYASNISRRFPLWAVRKAFEMVVDGKAGRRKGTAGFAPSVEECVDACERVCGWVKDEALKIDKVLSAEVICLEKVETSPEKRREMIERLRAEGLGKSCAAGEADGR